MSAVSISEAVSISFAGQCDRGKVREENQDSVLRVSVPLGDLLIVSDGIGGYAGGGVASRMAVEVLMSALDSMPTFFPPAIAIQEAACRANAEIFTAASLPGTPYNRMGTTVVLALLQQEPERTHAPIQAWIGHIGDSRAYWLHKGRLTRITRDHSAMQLMLDRKLISPEETRNHPDASVLTRTLGHEPTVEIELNEVALEPGDTLLLCSDGLWGFVPEPEIERVLADPALSAEDASHALLNLALDAGGHDNVGIEIARLPGISGATQSSAVMVQPEPAPEPQSNAEPVAGSADLPQQSFVQEPESQPDPETVPEVELSYSPAPGPERAEESQTDTPAPELEYVPRFQSAELPTTSFVKMLTISILAFAASSALVYSAVIQNWFGIDRFFMH